MTEQEYRAPDIKCQRCDATFRDHEWGHKAAQVDGWFLMKNGDAYCPRHVPSWVYDWRQRKKQG